MSERSTFIEKTNAIEAWHFLPDDRRLANEDGRLVKRRSILSVHPPLKLCRKGLHFAKEPA